MTQFLNTDLIITDFYCNGFFGRYYNLEGSKVLCVGDRWIVIRTTNDETLFSEFKSNSQMNEYLSNWTK